jgi:hypothetical protein
MGKYSFFKHDFDRADIARTFVELPEGSHIVKLNNPSTDSDTNGTYIAWPLVTQLNGETVSVSFRQYLNEKSYPYIKRNLKALMGESYDLFDIEYLDEWLDWLNGCYATVEVSVSAASNGKSYRNYSFTGLHKPITKPYPTPRVQAADNGFVEVDEDELPF